LRQEKCEIVYLRQFSEKRDHEYWQLGYSSCEHEQFSIYVPGIRVESKSSGSEIPDLHLWMRYSMYRSFKTADL
jgi:hypothetical protein